MMSGESMEPTEEVPLKVYYARRPIGGHFGIAHPTRASQIAVWLICGSEGHLPSPPLPPPVPTPRSEVKVRLNGVYIG